jgi:bisanhydrobacterioruberin hydratase
MMTKKASQNITRKETWIGWFMVIFYSVGVAGLSYEGTQELFIRLMPFSLLLGVGLMFWVHKNWTVIQVLVFALIAVMGFLVEVAGVLTGEVFGEYTYGRALGFKIFGTPPMIGINWLMLIYCVFIIMQKFSIPAWIKVILGSALMVIYDLIMEPVAIKLDMWSWGGDVIPLQNYIAWFVISLVLLSVMYLSKVRFSNKVAPVLFFVQMGFFTVLNFLL